MKKLIAILFLLSQTILVFSQTPEDCEGVDSIVLSGEYYDYELHDDCIKSVEITTLDEDTLMEGIMFIDNITSIHLIPTEGYKINLKPRSMADLIGLYPIDPQALADLQAIDRVKQGNDQSLKGPIVTIYPNPVETILTIKTQDNTILSYRITNSYGAIYLEEVSPSNNTISVIDLPTGLYYVTVQIENKTVTKKFYKN